MTKANMLTMLEIAVGEPNASSTREAFLTFQLEMAMQRLTDNGVEFSPTGDDPDYPLEDSNLIVAYAEFLVQKRDTAEGLPRHLEWAIHNRLIVQNTEGYLDV